MAPVRRESAGKIKRDLDHEGLAAGLAKMFDSDFWDKIHEKCVGCGRCVSCCPANNDLRGILKQIREESCG